MKALTFDPPVAGSGRPTLQQIDVPTPEPESGELLVRIQYAALNYFDYEAVQGDRNKAITKALKKTRVISGIEMAGIAESDGAQIKKGDRIFGYTDIFKGPWFHAEYAALAEKKMALVPDGLSLKGATSIIGGALTAITALERISSLQSGQHVLITGATGSVGVTAVQLAKHLGAEVTAICHSSQVEFARSQGASNAHAYDRGELPEALNQFDLVFDAAPSLSFVRARKFMKPRGCYITTMPHLDLMGFVRGLFSRRKWGFLLERDTDEKRMARLRQLMAEGVFIPAIDSIFPLTDAPAAFARQQETGKRGKILIDFS